MKIAFKASAVALVLSASLGGCAVYGPPATYTEVRYYEPAPTVYVRPAPVYVYPAPVYVQPTPVYTAPPVWFGLNFHYFGGRTNGHGWGRGHHHR